MPIKEGRRRSPNDVVVLSLVEPDYLGQLSYRPRRIFGSAELCSINTQPRTREGHGRALLKKFISNVGPGPVVTTEIVHSQTWERLQRLGVLHAAFNQGKYVITDRQTLAQEIPITRFLENGGIHIQELDIEYGTKKQLPTYNAIVATYDRGDDHFVNYFFTRIVGRIGIATWIDSIVKSRH